MEYFYIHGLCSSPGSKKAAIIRSRLAAAGRLLHAPDLNVPSFEEMRISAQRDVVAHAVNEVCGSGEKAVIIGSSLGALSSLLYTAANPGRVDRLLLLSPALRFIGDRLAGLAGSREAEWRSRGYLELEHYDGQIHRLGYQLAEDARQFDFDALSVGVPVRIIHGSDDEVVPFAHSVEWVEQRPSAQLCPIAGGDHSLLERIDEIWTLAEEFFA